MFVHISGVESGVEVACDDKGSVAACVVNFVLEGVVELVFGFVGMGGCGRVGAYDGCSGDGVHFESNEP